MLCMRVDWGSGTPVDIDPAQIRRTSDAVPPDHSPCWQVMDDALNPGGYLLVGWLSNVPRAHPRADF